MIVGIITKRIFMKRLLLILIFVTNLFSCGLHYDIYDFLDEYFYNFIPAKLANVDDKNPLYKYHFYRNPVYAKRVAYYAKIKKELNLDEWSKVLKLDKKVVEDILYHDKDLEVKDNEFREYLSFLRDYKKAFIDRWGFYLDKIYVNRSIIQEAKQYYQKPHSNFFKLRYAYNLARIYHFFGMYDEELKLINSLKNLKKQDSIVWEWIESLKAGALQHKGDFVNSAYLFAKVFSTHKSDKYLGYYDFKIKTDKQWQELLNKAKNDDEKLLFHFLRGMQKGNNLLSEYQEMLKIKQNSKWIDIAEYMLAQKAQYKYFNFIENAENNVDFDGNYTKHPIEFVEHFIKTLKSKRQKSDFDNYLLEYMFVLTKNNKPHYYDKNYNDLLNYIYYIKNLKSINEAEISKRLSNIKVLRDSAIKYTINKLSKLYPENSLKLYLAIACDELSYFDINRYMTIKTFKEYSALKAKKDKNLIEKLLLKGSNYHIDKDKQNLYYSLLYTGSGEFETALKYLEKVPKNMHRFGNFNPFNVYFDGNNYESREHHKPYPQKKFLETMIKVSSKKSVMDYFLRANGWYNISYFGNSPMLSIIYRRTTVIEKNIIKPELFKLNQAKKFYKKALSMTKDDEFKAKIIYQLMKVALAKSILTSKNYFKPEFERGEVFGLIHDNPQYQKLYYDLQNYKNTKYYQKIKNCAGFEYFK